MLIKYRFSINGYYVKPIWKDDTSKDYELESGQRFYRAKLSGKLVFIRDDYDWLQAQAFDTEFVLLIEQYVNSVWSNYWQGVFWKTDGDWDSDNKMVDVSLDAMDVYNIVLAGLEKEYNLMKLVPGNVEVEILKRSMIQVYIPGESVIACFFSGNTWEEDVVIEESDTAILISTYFFSLADTLHKISVSGTGTPAICVGEYTGESLTTWYNKDASYAIVFTSTNSYNVTVSSHGKTSADIGSVWSNSGNYWQLVQIIDTTTLRFVQYYHSNTLSSNGGDTLVHVRLASNTSTISYLNYHTIVAKKIFALKKVSDGVIYFSSKNDYSALIDGSIIFLADNGVGTLGGEKLSIEVYSRLVCDVNKVLGLATNDIPTDDLVAKNRNYKKVIGYAIDSTLISSRTQVAPTVYGLADSGEYFIEPYYLGIGKVWPVARSLWGNSSIWFEHTFYEELVEEASRRVYILKNASMIFEVIRVLLAEIDVTISHDGTSDYSQFLYGASNPITGNVFRVMITQKSNITSGEFSQPAQKAPITLQNVMDMLRDTFQLYWYIEAGKFKIEHISFFKNGRSYSVAPGYTADLTLIKQPKNQKLWALESSKWSYSKQELPERLQFNWMDDVTQAFDGFPIEINSKFVQPGKIDEINVAQFTPDIDYMLLNPLAINQDGFALMAGVFDNTNLFDILDPDYITENRINHETGTVVPNATFCASGYIPVLGNSSYYTTFLRFIAWYDSSKVYISGETSDGSPGAIIAPSNAEYIRCTTENPPGTFSIFKGKDSNGVLKLPLIDRTIDGASLTLQNGYCSWIYLHPNYWPYNLPSDNVQINDAAGIVYGIMRGKKQDVSYPSREDPNPMELVKTSLGDGEFEKLSVNLSTRMNKITLKYDTE
ncbi:MAG: hypothetical protein HQ522_07835 [Bacteroidetes bacterium]|nr:hypothetical protein [Bacteroidota bacterium]